jgi:hypothetical protein
MDPTFMFDQICQLKPSAVPCVLAECIVPPVAGKVAVQVAVPLEEEEEELPVDDDELVPLEDEEELPVDDDELVPLEDEVLVLDELVPLEDEVLVLDELVPLEDELLVLDDEV